MSIVAAYVLFIMMMLTVADVLARYFFVRSITGVYELVGFLLICAMTWGMAYCQIQKRHIRVTFLLERFSQKTVAIINILVWFAGFCLMSVMFWQVAVLAKRYFLNGAVSDKLLIPFFPWIVLLAIGIVMLALIFIKDLVHSFISLRSK